MLLPKIRIIGVLIGCLLALSSNAKAGLYGFHRVNDYRTDENTLRMDYIPKHIENYRGLMRENLLMLIDYAKSHNPNFQVVSHEGQYLLNKSKWEYDLEGYNNVQKRPASASDPYFLFNNKEIPIEPVDGSVAKRYLNSVDAVVINNFYCGNGKEEDVTINNNLGLISIENCSSDEELDGAIVRSLLDHKIIYAFVDKNKPFQDLLSQPMINDSAKNITRISEAGNITFLLDDSLYDTKEQMVSSISSSNYDVVVISPLFHNKIPFSSDDVVRMQIKRNGAKRLVLAMINVSEISPKDYFWEAHWRKGNPSWIVRESFVNQNAFITQYWHPKWRELISRHFKDVVITGYDGVFFTGIENNQYFEHLTPLE
ncbi:MAG: hypothetical protein IJV97_05375 [Alphaproteobacteria bacterium]|nr:hypothetical protein [Alphaproteobacteria bacterium]